MNVATLQKNCSGQRMWRFGVWPQKESQEQSQEGCLRSRCPTPTGTARSILEFPAQQGPSGWRTRTLTVGEAGPWQLRVLGPTALGGVSGSWGQRSRTASVTRNRPEAGSRAGDNCSCLSLNAQQRVLLSYLLHNQRAAQPTFWVLPNPASPAPVRWRRKREFAIVLLVPPMPPGSPPARIQHQLFCL